MLVCVVHDNADFISCIKSFKSVPELKKLYLMKYASEKWYIIVSNNLNI